MYNCVETTEKQLPLIAQAAASWMNLRIRKKISFNPLLCMVESLLKPGSSGAVLQQGGLRQAASECFLYLSESMGSCMLLLGLLSVQQELLRHFVFVSRTVRIVGQHV